MFYDIDTRSFHGDKLREAWWYVSILGQKIRDIGYLYIPLGAYLIKL